ncbi:MAG TPA: glycosyltransferase family 4 protein [Solirubrobacteraceae bacterium]|nr:glycosyltransferase family 4 protein [Solirubrobacteraceae bacterium]
MKINIIMGGIARDSGTAGHAIIFGYANGLLDRGHEVAIVSTVPAYVPQWFDLRARIVQPRTPSLLSACMHTAARYGRFRLGLAGKMSAKEALTEITARFAPWSTLPYRRANGLERISACIPPADITMATGAPTALPTCLFGTGTKVYFMQHYETYFVPESDSRWQHVYEQEVELSYKLPLHRIANSSWLAEHVRERHGGHVDLCLNAFDQQRFFPEGRRGDSPLIVASYSGRGAAWKGFADAAEAVRIIRSRVGDVRWRVFGENAELPPDNPIAPYEPIGVVDSTGIRRLFSEAHIALCPAWYESFPMYPMEAMACGCAVVTTPFGTEDYAHHEHNALVVPARDFQAMADAVVRLGGDTQLRERLVEQAMLDVKDFTWARSLDRMEELLRRFHAGSEPLLEDASVPAARER